MTAIVGKSIGKRLCEVLGITGPVSRLVIDVGVRDIVKVYVTRYLKADELDAIEDVIREADEVEIREVADVEVRPDTSVKSQVDYTSMTIDEFMGPHPSFKPGPLLSEDAAAIKDALAGHIRNMNAAFEASNPPQLSSGIGELSDSEIAEVGAKWRKLLASKPEPRCELLRNGVRWQPAVLRFDHQKEPADLGDGPTTIECMVCTFEVDIGVDTLAMKFCAIQTLPDGKQLAWTMNRIIQDGMKMTLRSNGAPEDLSARPHAFWTPEPMPAKKPPWTPAETQFECLDCTSWFHLQPGQDRACKVCDSSRVVQVKMQPAGSGHSPDCTVSTCVKDCPIALQVIMDAVEQSDAAIGPETLEPAILRTCATCAYRPCEPDSNLCWKCREAEKR